MVVRVRIHLSINADQEVSCLIKSGGPPLNLCTNPVVVMVLPISFDTILPLNDNNKKKKKKNNYKGP